MTPRKNYLYAYFHPHDENTPRYIGKGSDKRCHWWKLNDRKSRENQYGIYSWLRKLKAAGLTPTVRIILSGLTEKESFAWERGLIAIVGRIPNGPLLNLSDGGEGPSGCKRRPETRQRMSESQKDTWSNPVLCARHRLIMQTVTASADWKTKLKEGIANAGPNRSYNCQHSGRHCPARKIFKGTVFDGRKRKWRARIRVDGRRRWVRMDATTFFRTQLEAAIAYNRAVDLYWNGDGWKNRVTERRRQTKAIQIERRIAERRRF
jgi:hypothetical protein